MIASELIQQQRDILRTLHNAVRQYQQQVAQAKQRLESALEQIQAEQAIAKQQIKQEYEQARDRYITIILDAVSPVAGQGEEGAKKAEQAREQQRARLMLLETQEALTIEDRWPSPISSDVIRRQILEIRKSSDRKKLKDYFNSTPSYILALIFLLTFICSISEVLRTLGSLDRPNIALCVGPLLPFLLLIYLEIKERRNAVAKVEYDLKYLAYLYRKWLKITSERAQTQNAEAQEAYQRVIEQTKEQFSNSVRQLRPTVLGYTTLVDHTSPPWQSDAWQDWKPSALMPGVVRLGVFTLQPDQLKSEPAGGGREEKIKILGISDARLGGGTQ